MSLSENNCPVYLQYIDSNLDALLKGICEISNHYNLITNNTMDLYLDITKARGSSLDDKGRVLNFNRYITFDDPLDVVTPVTPGIEEYRVLFDTTKECRLNDDSYRKILLLLSQTRTTVASVQSLTTVISDVINADVFVGDAMDMKYITYYFLDAIPGWLEVCMKNYDILPRPAGMAVQYISAISRLFGFLIDIPQEDRDITKKYFSSFWKARFPESTRPVFKLPVANFLKTIPYHFHHLSQVQFEATQQLITRSVTGFLRKQTKYRDLQKLIEDTKYEVKGELAKFKLYNEANFGNYSWALSQGLEGSRLMKATAQASFNSWKAYRRAHLLNFWRHRMTELKKRKEDLRHNLHLDITTGWYFYKPAISSGFQPEYQAMLYQDDCGLWVPTDPFFIQLQKDSIELRHVNYFTNKLTKTISIDKSPFVMKYRNTYQEAKQKDDNGDTLDKLRRLIEMLHTAVKDMWHPAFLIDESSFHACLDLEYRAASMIQFRNYIRDKGKYRPNASDDDYDAQYWNHLYWELDSYYGSNRNYNEFWNERDKDALVMKRRKFLKYQRYLVRKAQERLSTQYSEMRSIYNDIRGDKPTFIINFSSTVGTMLDELKKDKFRDFEHSYRTGAGSVAYDPFYNAINLTNTRLPGDIEYNRRKLDLWKQIRDNYQKAVDSARKLMNECPRVTYKEEVWWAMIKHTQTAKDNVPLVIYNYDKDKDDEARSHNWGGYWSRSDAICTNKSADGYRTKAEQFYYVQKDKLEAVQRDWVDMHDRKYRQGQAELQTRTIVTQDRTLREIMNVYNSWTPDRDYIPYAPAVWTDEDSLLDWDIPPEDFPVL